MTIRFKSNNSKTFKKGMKLVTVIPIPKLVYIFDLSHVFVPFLPKKHCGFDHLITLQELLINCAFLAHFSPVNQPSFLFQYRVHFDWF